MIRTAPHARALIAILAMLVAGCSGGGGSVAPFRPLVGASSAPDTVAKSASVSFTMHWTAKSTAGYRHRNYVPSTAQSVTVSVNGGQTQYLNNPATQLTIAAPPGVDNFAFATYDEQNGEGNVLSSASVTQTVVAGTGNFVSATLNAVIASIGISLANATLPAGKAATTTVNVTALDADGNVIVGPGEYDTPIHIGINDPNESGTLALSGNLVQAPNVPATITLNYSGGTLASGLPGEPLSTVTASASGLATASVAFTPTPTFYPITLSYTGTPPAYESDFSSIVAGPDGNMWALDATNTAVEKITPSGNVSTYPFSNPNSFSYAQIISASDGNLWFTASAHGVGDICSISTSGSITAYQTASSDTASIADGKDGYLYYTDGEAIGKENLSNPQPITSEPALPEFPDAIAVGSDRNIYLKGDKGEILRLPTSNLSATASRYTSPYSTGDSSYYDDDIVLGPDGNIWFDDAADSNMQVLDESSFSVSRAYLLTPTGNEPSQITVGNDGAFWIANLKNTGELGISRVTTSGTTSFFPDTIGLGSKIIATAPDGSLWVAEGSTANLYKLVY